MLYYNQPSQFRNFLAVRYVVAACGTSLSTVSRVVEALEEIARLKRTDALLCDVSNSRMTSQMMARMGWEPHCPSRWHRHYIKRYYGAYPPRPEWIAPSC
jgi:hypothetical protein